MYGKPEMMPNLLYLMHRNQPIALLELANKVPIKYMEIYSKPDLPVGTWNENPITTKILLSKWYQSRTIPSQRKNLDFLLQKIGKERTEWFLTNSGVSLTDTYWFTDHPEELKWEEINFHENHYIPVLGNLLNNQLTFPFPSPDFTTDGVMEKFWYQVENMSYLAKLDMQKKNVLIANEVLYYQLAGFLGINTTPYFQGKYKEYYICSTPCFVKNAEDDYISAMQIKHDDFSRTGEKLIHYFMKDLGFEKEMKEMITLDCLFHNSDRHEKNFGVIRHPDGTIQFVPPFDNGYCLGVNRDISQPILKYDMRLFSGSREEILDSYGIPLEIDSSFFLRMLTNIYSFYKIPEMYYERAKEEFIEGMDLIYNFTQKSHEYIPAREGI